MRTLTIHREIRGFTLVELMVAMTLSLILLAGVLSVLYSSKVTYNENERVARLQENMRAGVEIIARDLRGGGFPGCSKRMEADAMVSVLNNPTSFYWNFVRPVEGYNAAATGWTPALPAPLSGEPISLGSDVLVIRTIRSNARVYPLNASMASGTSDIVVKKLEDETLPSNVPMLISDCQYATVFAVTGVINGATTATISHSTNSTPGDSPRNTNGDVGRFMVPGRGGMASVSPIDTIAYYIAPSSALDENGVSRGPSLWRISATEPTTGPRMPQEVIEGVEAMQIQYGVDLNGDFFVDAYRRADEITDWATVRSVSLAVVVRTAEEINPEVRDPQVFQMFPGNPATTYTSPADRRSRVLFTTTVALRNRTI